MSSFRAFEKSFNRAMDKTRYIPTKSVCTQKDALGELLSNILSETDSLIKDLIELLL